MTSAEYIIFGLVAIAFVVTSAQIISAQWQRWHYRRRLGSYTNRDGAE